MSLTDRQYIELIHDKGKALFGSKYNRLNWDNRIRKMLTETTKSGSPYTAKGIYRTIHWWFDLQGESVEKANNGFGIVPYVYDEAMGFYRDIDEMHRDYYSKEQLEGALGRDEEVVKVKLPQFKPKSYLKGFELS